MEKSLIKNLFILAAPADTDIYSRLLQKVKITETIRSMSENL